MNKCLFPLLLVLATSVDASEAPGVRPPEWADPVTESDLRNLYKVSDKVYRSKQPSSRAFHELKDLGIESVLNLRSYHTDDGETKGLGLSLYRVKMRVGNVSPDQIFQALEIIMNSEGPILVHCWNGSDRTGVVIAAYRMVFEGWSKADAIDEFVNGGFGHHRMLYPNLVESLNSLDIGELQGRLNL
jgi:tyrosine-protein phosphatase SIW14